MKKILIYTGPANALLMLATFVLIISRRFDTAFIMAIISLVACCLRYWAPNSNKRTLLFNTLLSISLIATLWILK